MRYRIEQSADQQRVKLTIDDMFCIELSPTEAYFFGGRIADFARFIVNEREPIPVEIDGSEWPFTSHRTQAEAADD